MLEQTEAKKDNHFNTLSLIQVQKASKSFNKKVVLKELDLHLLRGNSYGLLGKNGAGKSTLINLIVGLTTPTSGKVLVFDEPAFALSHQNKLKIGILTEQLPLMDELTGWEQLWLVGLMYGIEKQELKGRIESLFDYFFDDRDAMTRRCSTYSTGMKKKIGLMSAVLHQPEMLVLDEPFSGIDPVSATRMIDFFNAWMNPNRLLLISSHNLDQIEKIVSHIIVVHNQEIVFNDSSSVFTGEGLETMETKLYSMLQGSARTLNDIYWLIENKGEVND